MQVIIRVYIILSFFIYIILCSIVYMVYKNISEEIYEKKVKELNKTFGAEVQRQIQTIKLNDKLSKMDIDYIKSKIRTSNYFVVFNQIIIQLNKDEENKKYTKKYVEHFEEEILKNVRKHGSKDDTKRTFIVNLLGEYRLNIYELNQFLFKCLNTKSIYLRVETLKTFSKIGDITNFLKALEFISNRERYANDKVLIDILDTFNGNFDTLDKCLLLDFEKFHPHIQKNIIEHLRNRNVEFVKDKIIDILKSESLDKEVRISAIKYFSKVYCKRAKEEIKKLLNHKEWEYRAISASTLGKYKENDVIEALMLSISDHNWYVKYNSVISLLGFNEDNIIEQIIEKNDKYSIDTLLYAMLNQGKISYEDYLERTGKLGVSHTC